eukprot:m.181477 g.181477  ORF g.181477 m.181477 type:complete len:259 (+) comp32068_c0_seq1:169-945(+)
MISSPTLLFCTTLFIVPTHTSAAFNYGVGGVKFKNCASRTMTMYWKSFSGEPDYAGRVAPDCGTNGFQTYEGHEFFWSEYQQDPPVPTTYPGAKFVEFAIQEDQRLYYYIDDSTKPEVLAKLQEEIDFMEEYKNRTGRHWVGTTWPRPPPTFEFIQPEYVGQKIQVALPEVAAKWECTSDHIPDCYTDGGKILNENASQVETVDQFTSLLYSRLYTLFVSPHYCSWQCSMHVGSVLCMRRMVITCADVIVNLSEYARP